VAQGIRVAEKTWPEVEAALANNATAILPIAATCKEHGKHLPMATDYIQAEWLISQSLTQVNMVVWPTLGYGYYPAFVNYPGSCSLNEATFENVVFEIIQSIVASGAKNIFLLNTGISTIPPLKNTVDSFKNSTKIQLLNIYSGEHFCAAEKKLKQQIRGSHADEIETSIMLAIAPGKVNMDLADANTEEMQPGPLNRTQQNQPNYSPSGVYGDARLATEEKGKILLAAMLKDILQAIKDLQYQA